MCACIHSMRSTILLPCDRLKTCILSRSKVYPLASTDRHAMPCNLSHGFYLLNLTQSHSPSFHTHAQFYHLSSTLCLLCLSPSLLIEGGAYCEAIAQGSPAHCEVGTPSSRRVANALEKLHSGVSTYYSPPYSTQIERLCGRGFPR